MTKFDRSGQHSWQSREIVCFSVTLGFLCGTIEGLLSLPANHYRQPEVIWVGSFCYGSLFLLIGCCLAVICRFARHSLVLRLGFAAMLAFSFADWLRAYIMTPARLGAISSAVQRGGVALAAIILASLSVLALKRVDHSVAAASSRLAAFWAAGLLILGTSSELWIVYGEQVAMGHLRPSDPKAPNVILIIVDTLRADHLSTYGYYRQTTPYLSKMAERGALFENAISPSSWTLPSHASLFTGRMPNEHGATGLGSVLDRRLPTLGEKFQELGYVTAAFSANPFFFSRRVGLDRGFIHFEDSPKSFLGLLAPTFLGQKIGWFLYKCAYPKTPMRQNAHDINQRALSWAQDRQRPFFIVLNYFDVHDPYYSPRGFTNFSQGERPVPLAISYNDVPVLNQEQIRKQINAYDDALQYVDSEIQKLMQELEQLGLAQNTIFVVTSDHGELFGEHGLLLHANALYRSAIHVPLIVCSTGQLRQNSRVSAPVSTVDIGATLLAMVGAQPGRFPGQNLEMSSTERDTADQYAVSELAQIRLFPGWPSYNGDTISVVTPEWHYIWNSHSGAELYQWIHDPEENDDRGRDPEVRSLMQAFQEKTMQLNEETAKFAERR